MKKWFLIAAVLGLAGCLNAQDISGVWSGVLKTGGGSLHIVFRVQQTDSGYRAVMDSPDQGVRGLAVHSAGCSDGRVGFELKRPAIVYVGTFSGDTVIRGTFCQSGAFLPLDLRRGDVVRLRPQEPRPPYPYRSEEVVVRNAAAGVDLAGTLTLPENARGCPAVVLITGSGAQNRDEELMDHKPFLVLADYLTRRGIAVLRCDDRGTARSTGDFRSATSEDFAGDALAALAYLKTRPEIDSARIGLAGHSEGGMVACIAASREPSVAFVVSMAGTGVRGDSVLLTQNRAMLRRSGVPEGVCETYVGLLRKILPVVAAYPEEDIRTRRAALCDSLFGERERALPESMRENAVRVLSAGTPWMRYMLNYDPAGAIGRVRCPLLAINGTKDVQVDADVNLNAIRRAAEAGGNRRVAVKKYDGLNHLFQHSRTGNVDEYAQIEETFSEEAMSDIASWILGLYKIAESPVGE